MIQLRRLSATVLLGASLAILGAAPAPRAGPDADARAWRRRTQGAIDELSGVGVDAARYRAHWARADTLLKKKMTDEALRAFLLLASSLEGWAAAPGRPRRPAEALTDPRPGPGTRDPHEEDVLALAGPAGYGRWRPPSLRTKLEARRSGEFRRPLSGDKSLTLGHKIDHEKLKERVRASQSAAALRWSAWAEEAGREDGAATGKLTRRVSGGQVLEMERPAPERVDSEDGRPSALSGAAGVGGYRGRPVQAVVQDLETVSPLVGSVGVGGYGRPLREVRDGLVPREIPRYSRPSPGWPGRTKGPDPSEQLLEARPREVAVADPSTATDASDPDLDDLDGLDDLGGDDLGIDAIDEVDAEPFTPPKAVGRPTTVTVSDLKIRQDHFAGQMVLVEGYLGAPERAVPAWLARLAGGEVQGKVAFSLSEGAAVVDVIGDAGWVEDLAPNSRVRVQGTYVVDPEADSPDQERTLLADWISPP